MRRDPGGAAPGRAGTGLEDQAADFASLPAAQVGLIVSALKASGRAALAADKARRRQRKKDNRENGNYDESQLADRNDRQDAVAAGPPGKHRPGDPGTGLKEHYDAASIRCWRSRWPVRGPQGTLLAARSPPRPWASHRQTAWRARSTVRPRL